MLCGGNIYVAPVGDYVTHKRMMMKKRENDMKKNSALRRLQLFGKMICRSYQVGTILCFY